MSTYLPRSLLRPAVTLALISPLLAGCATPPGSTAGQDTKVALRQAAAQEEELERRIESAARYATGLSYDLNDQSDLALVEMVRAAEADPTSEAIVIEAVRRCIQAQKADQAVALLEKATSFPGASGTLYAWLGLAYAQLGKPDLAITANRTAIKKMPQSLTAYQNLAQVYLQRNQTNDALRVIDEAAAQPTDDPGFLIDLTDLYGRFGRGHLSQTPVLKERVLKVLDRAADLGPSNPIHLLRLADTYLQLGELKKAEPFYRQLINDHADLPSLRSKLTEIYLRSGQRDKASEQLEAIARTEPTNPKAYLVLGALAVEEQKFSEAAEHFERAIKLDPDLEQVYYDVAGLKLRLRKPEEALAILEKARARFKLSFALEFYTGIAYRAAEKFSEALNHFTSAEAIAKAMDPSRLNHLFYFQMGSTYERTGNIDEAEKYFRESLKLAPEDAETLNYLGYMWAENDRNLEEAQDLINQAVDLEPTNAAFLDSQAWVLFKLNKPAEALPIMLKAIEHAEEPDPTLFDHLGDIYSALKRPQDAREAWKKALDLKPDELIRKKLDAISGLPSSAP